MNEKKTEELLNILNKINNPSNLDSYLNETIKNCSNLDLPDFFNKICIEKNIKRSTLINNAGINRTYGYQILNGSKKPSRNKILQLCIAAKLNLEDTQKALTLGNSGKLYPKNSRDSIIIFGINKGISLDELNDLLFDYQLDVLLDEE